MQAGASTFFFAASPRLPGCWSITRPGNHYSYPLIPLWNAAGRVSFFVIITDLLDRQHRFLALNVSLAQQDSLTGATTFFTALKDNLVDHVAQNGWPVGFSIGVAVFHSRIRQAYTYTHTKLWSY
jgi:hypothetical protein